MRSNTRNSYNSRAIMSAFMESFFEYSIIILSYIGFGVLISAYIYILSDVPTTTVFGMVWSLGAAHVIRVLWEDVKDTAKKISMER